MDCISSFPHSANLTEAGNTRQRPAFPDAMDVIVASPSSPEHSPRKRSKSTLFKSFISPKNRMPSPSKNPILRDLHNEGSLISYRPPVFDPDQLILPTDHPHANQILSGVTNASGHKISSPRKSSTRDLSEQNILEDPRGRNTKGSVPMKRKLQLTIPKDKENTMPTSSDSFTASTPIWSQYANRSPQRKAQDEISKTELLHRTTSVVEEPHTTPMKSVNRFHQNPKSWFDSRNTMREESRLEGEEPSRISRTSTGISKPCLALPNPAKQSAGHSQNELDAALEAILDSRNVSENLRPNMRNLDNKIKADLIRHGRAESRKPEKKHHGNNSVTSLTQVKSPTDERRCEVEESTEIDPTSPSGRSRSRSRVFAFGKSDRSPSKKPRSLSRPRSLMSLKNLSSKNLSSTSIGSFGLDGAKESKEQAYVSSPPGAPAILTTPYDFVKYLQTISTPQSVEIGKVHKLRLLTRNESVTWVGSFIIQGGMDELLNLLDRIMKITWREEHDDLLLHEVLHCLRGLSTTRPGVDKLSTVASSLFPDLLKMLFDDERKGPSEYSTRTVVINLMFIYLAAAPSDQVVNRAERLLGYLSDRAPDEEQTPLPFILEMRRRRPYQAWCKEITNVTKEVFWIFMHHHNVISIVEKDPMDIRSYAKLHFPKLRQPVAAAPYVGGIEWEATNYLGDHLDLMNGLIATQPDKESRNAVREHLRASGFERVMGKTLRTCKEKFYGAVHDGLRTWVAAADEDGWPTRDIEVGPVKDEYRSPTKSINKNDVAPKIELPKLDFGFEGVEVKRNEDWV